MTTGSFWLVKSEPAKYAFSDLQRDGRTVWDGVRNNQAALYLKAMKVGDQVLYYHSQEGLAVVGVAEVAREAFPDPTDPAGRFVAVELTPVRALARPVSLAEMKAEPRPGRHGHVPPVSPVGLAGHPGGMERGAEDGGGLTPSALRQPSGDSATHQCRLSRRQTSSSCSRAA